MVTLLFETIPLLRGALVVQLNAHPLITKILCLPAIDELESHISAQKPDLLWLDGAIESVRQAQLVKFIHKQYPTLKTLVFGGQEQVMEVKKLFKQGLHAYLPKSSTACEIDEAIASLSMGSHYLPTSFQATISFWLSSLPAKKSGCNKLTEREKEVLMLIVDEFTTIEIAQKLFISQCTVETHRINLIHKLGVKNTAGLVREAISNQLYSFS